MLKVVADTVPFSGRCVTCASYLSDVISVNANNYMIYVHKCPACHDVYARVFAFLDEGGDDE